MKKKLLFFVVCVMLLPKAYSQTDKFWTITEPKGITPSKNVERASFPSDYKLFKLNLTAFSQAIFVSSSSTVQSSIIISLPNANGQLERFQINEASNFDPQLQQQFPEIRSFSGVGLDDKLSQVRLSFSPFGIQTMIFRVGKNTEFMEPYSQDTTVYAVYSSEREKGKLPFVCTTPEERVLNVDLLNKTNTHRSSAGQLKIMRLALSCTGEYGTYFGGATGALAQMNATMTRVNGVFEKDLAVHLNIISNSTSVIYTDATTDPYSDAASMANWNSELQTTLTSVIGDGNYDIGHLFGASGGGGNAGCIGCVCVDGSKGSGITSPGTGAAMGDNFDIDYVAHEMGHQLGANHTFSFSTEDNSVNVEPGSGSTIMSYAGITGSTDVQAHSDDIFAYVSINQIQVNLATKSCPVTKTLTNHTPVVNAGANWTIPKGTPFILTGSATDQDGDTLSYVWEEKDDATGISSTATTAATNSFPSGTKTNGPNFRTFNVTATPVRYLPSLSNLVNNTLTWEQVSTVARTLNFSLTARDNATYNGTTSCGQTSTSSMVVTVSTATGPFTVTSQATTGISYTQGTTQAVTWTVNSTDTLPGAANVDILLSTDGGLTYPTVLVSNTPNDGSENVTIPNIAAPFCRIMVRPTGHIFFNINSQTFAIGYIVTTTTTCKDYTRTFSPAQAIPTNYTGYGIAIADSYTITSAKVKIVATATRTNQLTFGLGKPGTGVVDIPLFAGGSCGNIYANLNVVFDDLGATFNCANANSGASYKPTTALSGVNGMNSAGTWYIAAKSTLATNTLSSATITFCKTDVTTVLNNQDFSLAEFSIYPNPNTGNFTVQFNSTTTNDVDVFVHDLRGRMIFEKKYNNSKLFSQNIQLNNVETGVYLVTVKEGDKQVVRKIVIE